MFDIKIVYREGHCKHGLGNENFNTQCFTCWAGDTACKFYNSGKHEPNKIPFGDCVNAVFDFKHKGMRVKSYEAEIEDDVYNPHLRCMALEVGNKRYECEKVVIDGECIYNDLEEL